MAAPKDDNEEVGEGTLLKSQSETNKDDTSGSKYKRLKLDGKTSKL